MASMTVPSKYDDRRLLLADDEPEHLEWLVEYLEANGFQVTFTTNVREAIQASTSLKFRAYVIDLNLPLGGWTPPKTTSNETFNNYLGLHIIKYIRSQGNAGKRVIAYSAHHNEHIASEMKRMYCQYIVKGRPHELKEVIKDVVANDPSTSTKPRAKKVVPGERSKATASTAKKLTGVHAGKKMKVQKRT